MGCFNTTCFASQQTIKPGEVVYLYPISQSLSYKPIEYAYKQGREWVEGSQYSFTDSPCYPNRFWAPYGPLIEAIYDDYGRFKLVDTPTNLNHVITWFDILYNYSAVTKEGENSSHDVPFNWRANYQKDTEYSFLEIQAKWDYMWGAIQEHRLFALDHRKVVPVSFAVMHKVTGDYLMSLGSPSEAPFSAIRNHLNSNFKAIRDFVYTEDETERKDKFFAYYTALDECSRLEFLISASFIRDVHLFYPKLLDNLRSMIDSYFQSADKYLEEFSLDFIATVYDLLKDQYRFKQIISSMQGINIHFSPMVYAGQDYCNEIGTDYLKMVQYTHSALAEKYKDEFSDDEEEEDRDTQEVNAAIRSLQDVSLAALQDKYENFNLGE